MVDDELPLSLETHVGVRDGEGERIAPVAELNARFGVDALIRLHLRDYALIENIDGPFVHFNLEVTLNAVGKRYALLPIVRAGFRDSLGVEVLPVLDLGRHRVGTCLEVHQRVAVDDVEAEHYAHSLPTIKNAAELRRALLERYTHLFPLLADDQIIDRGCAITRLYLQRNSN